MAMSWLVLNMKLLIYSSLTMNGVISQMTFDM